MFERFTQEARRAVVGAQEEARRLGHDWIGTEHLLLGLVRDETNGAAQVLAAVGVPPNEARAEIEREVPAGESRPHGHIPFTPSAKKVLELSLREALRLKHRTIEPEHILLGLLREGKGVAVHVLRTLGPDVDTVRQEVIKRIATWPDPGGFRMVSPDMPATTRAGAAIFTRARQLSAGAAVGSQHILRALLEGEDSLAARALTALGVKREAVERELERLDPSDTSDEPPEQAGARRTRLHVAGDVITMRLEDPQLASRLATSLRRWTRPGGEVEVTGTEPEAREAFGRLWQALERTSTELVVKLSGVSLPPARGESKPPGWTTRASVAGYSVYSEPGGPRGRLWTAEDVEEDEVRAWLFRWLQTGVPVTGAAHRDPEPTCTYFTVHIGRTADVVPGADDPDAWTMTNFSFGPGPAPADWPRLPLADLLAFAIADLAPPAAA